MRNHFRANLRELEFFLWELLAADRTLLGKPPHHGLSRADCDELLERARAFALEMGDAFPDGEHPESYLGADGIPVIPEPYAELWRRWTEWEMLGRQAAGCKDSAQGALPMPVKQAAMEMLMGANPAFMCFGGFTAPASMLVREHGTAAQKEKLQAKLDGFHWDACYCATESGAGSDLLAIQTRAWPIDDSTWAIQGEKRFITAGMHSLTENTVYIVLARLRDGRSDSMFLSCFLVPRLWPTEEGGLIDNHVRCAELPRKLGFKGCPNTPLEFGQGGTTRAWLLGDRRNAGMLQFMTIARHARINSGLFATGIASTAYLNSLAYARRRVQGRRLDEASSAGAPSQPIIAHADVQRMLLDMKARLEACRYLIGRVTNLSALRQQLPDDDEGAEQSRRWGKLIDVLVPVVKTFTADQAVHVCNTAMQVHGGIAYTSGAPIEQYLRDARILSIWEGTSYVQALLLVRDALGLGRSRKVMGLLEELVDASLDARPMATELLGRREQLKCALGDCLATVAAVDEQVKRGQLNAVGHYFTRLAEALGATLGAWGLLESAQVSVLALRAPQDAGNTAFYQWKIKAMNYFFDVVLPPALLAMRMPKGDLPAYALADADLAACMEPV